MPETDYEAAQAAEWGAYVANDAIFYNGARAYNAGDPVPASNVALHHYLDTGQVRAADAPPPELDETSTPAPPVGEPIELNASSSAGAAESTPSTTAEKD
jgi:hypothetical protein